MDLLNLSAEPDAVIYGWLERADALRPAVRVVSLPDTCPGKSPLPTGTAYLTRDPGWRRFALSDVGCGMTLVRSTLTLDDVETDGFRRTWDALCDDLATRRNRGLGDLGSGNHFLDAAASIDDGRVYLLVHTGSRKESGLVDDLIDKPAAFDAEFARIRSWAGDNRAAVLDLAEKHVGRFADVAPGTRRLDRDHNHVEQTDDGTLIRKGVQRVTPGKLAAIPSNLLDGIALVRATDKVAEIGNCLPHGTGRTMSRAAAKEHAAGFDFADLRRQVYIPPRIADASLRTETPTCYRRLDDALALMDGYLTEIDRLVPVAYIGQL